MCLISNQGSPNGRWLFFWSALFLVAETEPDEAEWQTQHSHCSLLSSVSVITVISNPSLCLCKPHPPPAPSSVDIFLSGADQKVKEWKENMLIESWFLLFLVFFGGGFILSFLSLNHHFSVNIRISSIKWLCRGYSLMCYWASRSTAWMVVWLRACMCVCVSFMEKLMKPCWTSCFLVCSHNLNLMFSSLSHTFDFVDVCFHQSFQFLLALLFFPFIFYFTFYLMDQSNHLFSYLLLCFFSFFRRVGGWHVFMLLMAQVEKNSDNI